MPIPAITAAPHPPRAPSLLRVGPGLVMAASGIGASDIISATVGGARYGVSLLWALALGAFFKFVLTEGLARWQLATGLTLLEGWARHLPRWVLWLFMAYLILWAIVVSGALVGGCGLAVENITGGRVPRSWGGFAQAAIAFGFIFAARSDGFSRVMKPLIILMFLSVIACVLLTYRAPAAALAGLLVPVIPSGGGAYVLSLVGGIGGSLTLLSYNYLLREGGESPDLRSVRVELAFSYLFTAVFGLSVMLVASHVFHAAGIPVTDQQVVSLMAGQLAVAAGPLGFYVYAVGFWAAVLASLIGVWRTVPTIFADCYGLLRSLPPSERQAVIRPDSREYRMALAFMALASVPFAFIGRPLAVVVAFTIIGSLFIPFLAATLLYLNNLVPWSSPIRRNSLTTNAVLALIIFLFLVIGGWEISLLLRR